MAEKGNSGKKNKKGRRKLGSKRRHIAWCIANKKPISGSHKARRKSMRQTNRSWHYGAK